MVLGYNGPVHATDSNHFAPVGITVRPIGAADLRPLHAALFSTQPFAQFQAHYRQFGRWQTCRRACWLVAVAGVHGLVGSGQLRCYPRRAEIANLIVAAAWRGQGIGAALVQSLVAAAQQLDWEAVEVLVAPTNGRAQTFYRRLGFTLTQTLQLTPGAPALLLRKPLRGLS